MLLLPLMSVRRFIAIWLSFLTPLAWGSIPGSNIEEKRGLILADFAQRISPEFHISAEMKDRVSFWFDIYTLYGSDHHVIHHVRYPWIVYEVIDVTERVATGKGPLWLRKERAQKFVNGRKAEIQKILKQLAKNPRQLKTAEHRRILELVKAAPGSTLHGKLKLAAGAVRSQLGQKDFFHSGLEQSTYYLSHMEEEFESQGLPTELTRMPFVESSFNTRAKSRVGASGIWQIMPKTGKAYLKVGELVDERNNPIKATKAAGRLLKSYHRALKSWPLTVTSYNHGIGNIRKAIKAARSEHLPTIISRYHQGDFKFASSNFYACFLAALHAEKYHELLFPDIERLNEKKFVITQLKNATRTKSLLKKYNMSEEDFVRFNLDLVVAVKKNSLLPKGLRIFLPEGLDKPLAANQGKEVSL